MLVLVVSASAAVYFNDYFIDKTLRIDFYMTGNFNSEIITTDQMYQLGFWVGNPKNPIFPFNIGDHCIKVYSKIDNPVQLIKMVLIAACSKEYLPRCLFARGTSEAR